MDSTIQKYFRDSALVTSQKNRFPVSRPDDRAIPSGRSSVHCSSCPDDVPYRSDTRQTKHHPFGWRGLLSGPSTVSRSFCSNLHLSGRLSSPSGRLSVFDQASNSFQVHLWEDWCNRSDDVDSHPDELLLKARIVIQIQSSRRQSAWSRRAFNRYGNCWFDFNHPDARTVNMEIACWRSTVRTAIPHGPDAQSLIWKLLVADMRPFGWQCLTVRTRLSNRKDFQRKSQKFWSHSCPSGRLRFTVRTYYCSRPFEPSAYK
jgi:hypothetical protein